MLVTAGVFFFSVTLDTSKIPGNRRQVQLENVISEKLRGDTRIFLLPNAVTCDSLENGVRYCLNDRNYMLKIYNFKMISISFARLSFHTIFCFFYGRKKLALVYYSAYTAFQMPGAQPSV